MNLAIFRWWARLLTPKTQVRDFDGNMFAYNIPETVLIINCDLLPHPFVSNDGFIRPIFCLILRHTFSRINQDYYFNFQINSSNFIFRNFNLVKTINCCNPLSLTVVHSMYFLWLQLQTNRIKHKRWDEQNWFKQQQLTYICQDKLTTQSNDNITQFYTSTLNIFRNQRKWFAIS